MVTTDQTGDGLGGKVGLAMKEPNNDGNVLYLDGININILAVTLYYGLQDAITTGN